VGLLVALANTQLTTRLERENRMFSPTWFLQFANEQGGDQCTAGLNFETLRPRRDVLKDYQAVIDRIYAPKAYFGRMMRVARELNRFGPPGREGGKPGWRIGGVPSRDWMSLLRLLLSLARNPLLLIYFVRSFTACARENPGSLHALATFAAFYLHVGPFARRLGFNRKTNRSDRLRSVADATGVRPGSRQ
jgi:hypothetical protein